MNREDKSQPDASDEGAAAAAPRKTPSSDMQPDDAGTPESGNTGNLTSAEPAMKQTSKTDAERNRKP
jgi:hypothetical protein